MTSIGNFRRDRRFTSEEGTNTMVLGKKKILCLCPLNSIDRQLTHIEKSTNQYGLHGFRGKKIRCCLVWVVAGANMQDMTAVSVWVARRLVEQPVQILHRPLDWIKKEATTISF
jgi:hypothetical protein